MNKKLKIIAFILSMLMIGLAQKGAEGGGSEDEGASDGNDGGSYVSRGYDERPQKSCD